MTRSATRKTAAPGGTAPASAASAPSRRQMTVRLGDLDIAPENLRHGEAPDDDIPLRPHSREQLLTMLERMGAETEAPARMRKGDLVAWTEDQAAARRWAPACLAWNRSADDPDEADESEAGSDDEPDAVSGAQADEGAEAASGGDVGEQTGERQVGPGDPEGDPDGVPEGVPEGVLGAVAGSDGAADGDELHGDAA